MIRTLHLWLGLLALILTSIVGLSGAGLAIFPAAERLTAPQAEATLTVAELADRIRSAYPGVEQIRRAPSGRIVAYWFDDGVPGAAVIDPATGFGVASADPNQAERWLTNLHRSLFLGDAGRITVAAAAAAMLALSLSGAALIARRTGGWQRWFARLKGPLAGRIHVEIGRVAVAGLVLSSATGLWMAASTFELLPAEGVRAMPPSETSGTTGIELSSIAFLRDTPVADLRDLSFPEPGDATDVFKLTTDRGTGYVDQGTGALLVWADRTSWERVFDTVHMLHTGRGAAVLGLVLGLLALGVPAMGVTGATIWYAGWRASPRIAGNRPARTADTILLVGSEGGSTWGFAATLHTALTKAGYDVHVGRMSDFAPRRYARAARFILLAATYGDGAAPASATGFLDSLAAIGALRRPPSPCSASATGAFLTTAPSRAPSLRLRDRKVGPNCWPSTRSIVSLRKTSPGGAARSAGRSGSIWNSRTSQCGHQRPGSRSFRDATTALKSGPQPRSSGSPCRPRRFRSGSSVPASRASRRAT